MDADVETLDPVDQTDHRADPTRVAYALARDSFRPKLEDMMEAIDRAADREFRARLQADVLPGREKEKAQLFHDSIALDEAGRFIRRLIPHRREFARWLAEVESRA